MSRVRFIVDMRLNLFCHFMVCADIHRYIKNRIYRQANYSLFDEDSYGFFKNELPVYCLELLLKTLSDHPNFDADCIKKSLDSYLFSFLGKKSEKYLEYWQKREEHLLAIKQRLEEEWPSIEEKLHVTGEGVMGEKLLLDDLRIHIVDAYYGRSEAGGVSSTAEVNTVDDNLFLICACELNEVSKLLRIIIHEAIHRPLSRIVRELSADMKLNTVETNVVSETFAMLIEKELCDRIGVPSMTEEEIQKNVEKFGFLGFYLQTASSWQDHIKGANRPALRKFIKSQVEKGREALKRCTYSSSFL